MPAPSRSELPDWFCPAEGRRPPCDTELRASEHKGIETCEVHGAIRDVLSIQVQALLVRYSI